MVALIVGACNNAPKKAENPFFSEYTTPFKIPPFSKITNEDYLPAFEKGIQENKAEIEAIVNNTEEPTFENTIVALAESGELLQKVSSVFFAEDGSNTNAELQKIAEQVSPMLSAHYDEISLNEKLFKRVKAVYNKKDELNLTEEQAYILENKYKDFERSGANLPKEKQEQLKSINQQLSSLTLKFSQNVLAETNSFMMVVDKKDDLAGLPEASIKAASELAKSKGMEGKWVFNTQKISMIPFLQYADNRDLRKKLYLGYINRANNNNEFDNKKVLSDIVKLRCEKAQLLGFKNYADYRLEPRMAKNADNVMELLNKIWDPALALAKKEAKEMQKIIKKDGGKFKLQSWDWWYYAEKIRKERYNLDENELRPYFKLENVRKGAFLVANKLYGITFEPIDNVPTIHPEQQAFEVKEADGSPLGIFFTDYFPRESKRGGAWCSDYRGHSVKDGKEIHPLVTNTCNFTKPSGDEPALLNIDEVETLFHEFGHALDAFFAKNTYSISYVARDFVELPSQIMEHWSTEPEVMKMYAKHYKTGEIIPDDLIAKMQKSSHFNQGFINTEFLAAAYLDMALHSVEKAENIDIAKFEDDFLHNKLGLIPEIESRYRCTYFRHIMGGYDVGYYGYLWAAVLDNDAYETFLEGGLFNKDIAKSFRTNILEKNGLADPAQLYRDFRGRDPKVEALLKHRGLK